MASVGKPRRTLIIVENLPSPFDRRVWQEATTLRDAGYVVTIVCPTGRGYESRFEIIDDIHIRRYRLPFEAAGAVGYFVEYLYALIAQFLLAVRVYLTRGFDVIHACNPPDTVFLVALPFRLLGVRFLFDHHDINPELYEAKFGRRDTLYRLMLLLERWTFACAKVSIATNESYRRIAIERGNMDPQRVFVVRSGPDLSRLRIAEADSSRKHGRRYLVGYLGVMGKQEGIDLLLESIRYIVFERTRDDIHFTLIGGGTELDALVQTAVELGVADYVTFTGRIPDSDLLEVLNAADVCVNPDRANEMNDKSTMNKIMEYMALGKPIVQFDLTEGRFSAGEASLYARCNDTVDLADKILELLADEPRRHAMGEAGRLRVQNELSWEYEAPKLLRAYDAVFESGTRA
jgi:glycosyltransferase involved in cell wall biosynthesis